MPKYRVTVPSYRQGAYLVPGDIIDVPEKEASRTWVKLDEAPPAPPLQAETTTEPPRGRRGRASDSEPGQA